MRKKTDYPRGTDVFKTVEAMSTCTRIRNKKFKKKKNILKRTMKDATVWNPGEGLKNESHLSPSALHRNHINMRRTDIIKSYPLASWRETELAGAHLWLFNEKKRHTHTHAHKWAVTHSGLQLSAADLETCLLAITQCRRRDPSEKASRRDDLRLTRTPPPPGPR